jgi:hypothetical protein
MNINTERTVYLSSAAVVGVQDILCSVSPLPSIRELFTFSPFGLCCRSCNKGATIQLDERSINNHLKKHGIHVTISKVRCILEDYTKEVSKAKVSGSIELYRRDKKTYVGYLCICGQAFSRRKDNALWHCQKVGCNFSKLKQIKLIKLCCG